jgi:hypothetical protein
MAHEFSLQKVGTMWFLWNLEYGVDTDSGDAGFITQTAEGFIPNSRGDIPVAQATCATLDDAVAVLRRLY